MLKQRKEEFEEELEGAFPTFSSLNRSELINHQAKVRSAFKCPSDMAILDVFDKIIAVSEFIPNVNAKDNSFSFEKLLERAKVSSKLNVFLDWHRFDEIDCIELSKFSEYFDDIWYPEANDIYVYDETFTWFILVTHYGAISIARVQ